MLEKVSKLHIFIAGGFALLAYVLLSPPFVAGADSHNHEKSKYYHDDSTTYQSSVLERHSKTSRVQCALKCKRHLGCVDVAFREDKVCLLLGKPGPQPGVDEILPGLKKFAMVELKGTDSVHLLCAGQIVLPPSPRAPPGTSLFGGLPWFFYNFISTFCCPN